MPVVVEVPLNTMLADLDESLRTLLRRELERHGFDGVEVAFDAPSREWSSQLSAPTVNVFLYDLRPSEHFQPADFDLRRHDGGASMRRPPLMMECSYAITAWTQAVEDEHRLLSQVLGVLFAFPVLPADVLHGRLSDGSQRFPLEGRLGQPRGDGKADFWSSVGGRFKPSVDYVIGLGVEAGTTVERGPEVRTQTLRAGLAEASRTRVELHRAHGYVRAGGEPVGDAWVVLPELGRWTASWESGDFVLDRVPAGTHRCVARTRDGRTGEGSLVVPGAAIELTVG